MLADETVDLADDSAIVLLADNGVAGLDRLVRPAYWSCAQPRPLSGSSSVRISPHFFLYRYTVHTDASQLP